MVKKSSGSIKFPGIAKIGKEILTAFTLFNKTWTVNVHVPKGLCIVTIWS